jgi:hypothetical protein
MGWRFCLLININNIKIKIIDVYDARALLAARTTSIHVQTLLSRAMLKVSHYLFLVVVERAHDGVVI